MPSRTLQEFTALSTFNGGFKRLRFINLVPKRFSWKSRHQTCFPHNLVHCFNSSTATCSKLWNGHVSCIKHWPFLTTFNIYWQIMHSHLKNSKQKQQINWQQTNRNTSTEYLKLSFISAGHTSTLHESFRWFDHFDSLKPNVQFKW